MSFDPYSQWLNIAGDERPPNHYALLGLPLFESDDSLILDAFTKRFERVRRYQVGEHSDDAVRLLGELSRAFRSLTSPQVKLEYDRQMGGVISREAVSKETSDVGGETRGQLPPDWTDVEACVDNFLRTSDEAELVRGETLAEEVDPIGGGLRFAQLSMRRGAGRERFRQTLQEYARQEKQCICGECFQLVAPPVPPVVMPIEVTQDGNVVCDVCRITARHRLLWTFFHVDKPEGKWTGRAPDASISRWGATLIAAAMALAPPLLATPIIMLEGGSVPRLFGAFAFVGLLAVGLVRWLYRPRLATAIDVAWEEIIPQLLEGEPSRETAGFVVGLLRVSPDDVTEHTAVARRAIQRLRIWTAYHNLPYEYLAELYQHELFARCRYADAGRSAVRLLEEIADGCLHERHPLPLLDVVTRDGELLHLLPNPAKVALRIRLLAAGLTAKLAMVDLLELPRASRTFRAMWGDDAELRARWIAAMTAIHQWTASRLAVMHLDRVFELVEQGDFVAASSWPSLLAVSRNRTIAVCAKGVYFGGTYLATPPQIQIRPILEWVESRARHARSDQQSPDDQDGGFHKVIGYTMSLNGRNLTYPAHPGAVAATLTQLTEMYANQLRPQIDKLLAEPRPLRWNRWTTGTQVVCTRCGAKMEFVEGQVAATEPVGRQTV